MNLAGLVWARSFNLNVNLIKEILYAEKGINNFLIVNAFLRLYGYFMISVNGKSQDRQVENLRS